MKDASMREGWVESGGEAQIKGVCTRHPRELSGRTKPRQWADFFFLLDAAWVFFFIAKPSEHGSIVGHLELYN